MRYVLGKTDVKQLLKKRPHYPAIKASVSFNNDVSATAMLIEIIAEDRSGCSTT